MLYLLLDGFLVVKVFYSSESVQPMIQLEMKCYAIIKGIPVFNVWSVKYSKYITVPDKKIWTDLLPSNKW